MANGTNPDYTGLPPAKSERGLFRRELLAAIQAKGTKRKRGMQRLAERLVTAALDRESWALREIIDRVDGRAIQSVDVQSTFRQIDVSSEPMTMEAWRTKFCIEGEAEDVTTSSLPGVDRD